MLTGDKVFQINSPSLYLSLLLIYFFELLFPQVETATCIAISTGLKSAGEEIFTIRDVEDEMELVRKLNEFKQNSILVIDGVSLQTALTHKEKLFYEIATNAPGVVCCRVSPT